MWTIIFAPDLIEYAFFLEFPFQTQKLWEESIQMKHAMCFTNVSARKITGICTKKSMGVLKYFEMAVATRRHRREQKARGRRERIFSTCINLF